MNKSFFLLFLIGFQNINAQNFPTNFNLIPNGGFEFTPHLQNTYLGDTTFVNNTTCWIKANSIGGLIKHVDNIFNSYEKAYKGEKAAEISLALEYYNILKPIESQGISEGKRSYLQTKLFEPLISGTQYYLTFYAGYIKNSGEINHYNNGNLVTNLGALFTNDQVKEYENNSVLAQTPQIRFSNWDSIEQLDTFVYIKLSGIYTASGGENYLTLGNFDSLQYLDIKHINYNLVNNDTNYGPTFYTYIDNISLMQDTTLPKISLDEWNLGNDTIICTKEQVTPFLILQGNHPYFFDYTWNTGETTPSITINQSGTYWCRVNWGCDTYTDSITVLYLDELLPELNLPNDTSICNAYDLLIKVGMEKRIMEKKQKLGFTFIHFVILII